MNLNANTHARPPAAPFASVWASARRLPAQRQETLATRRARDWQATHALRPFEAHPAALAALARRSVA